MQRRNFLKVSLGAIGAVMFCPTLEASVPLNGWLTGFKSPDGKFGVARINSELKATPLFYTPMRLHGMSINPAQNLIVAPARRPDKDLFVFDMAKKSVDVIKAIEGRHFFGHGTFSADGRTYFTAENDYMNEKGVIGVYDVTQGFKRISEWNSGGIGPHEIKRYKDRLVIANGGILTHPDLGRAKLNIDTMAPNLSFINLNSGHIERQLHLPIELHQLSIRHMDIDNDGTAFVGLQDQIKGRRDLPLVWHSKDNVLTPMAEPDDGWQTFNGYVGSVSANQGEVCVSSPRGNCIHIWGQTTRLIKEQDVCGVAPLAHGGFLRTSGLGKVSDLSGKVEQNVLSFDNHCIPL